MKEDYLWNKNGSNAEIEQLEIALRAFRYREIAPPELPAKIVSFEKKSPRRFFRLSLAFGSLACLSLICLGVWFSFSFSSRTIETAKNAPEKIAAPPIESSTESSIESSIDEQRSLPGEKVAAPKVFKIKKFAAPVVRRNNLPARNAAFGKTENLIARSHDFKKPADEFSRKELYAYHQLMLALSITGSKLKLVKDKIDRAE